MKERSLIVRQGHRDYSLKSKPGSGNALVPFLLLKGNWLEKAGFMIDREVKVLVKDECLVILPKNS